MIWFPSPCGVLVLKLRVPRARVFEGSGFRPLAGFWFLNTANATVTFNSYDKFPSPCGVLVLKFINDIAL